MKKIFLFCVALCTLAACDEIKEDERFSDEPVTFTPLKNVLIEDFTGQNCLNCPNAAGATHALQKLYGEEHVIAVAIHGGDMKMPLPATNPLQLATEQGDEYNTHWNIASWPAGMVDRTGVREYTTWSAEAVKRMQLTSPVEMEASLFADNAAEIKADSVTLQVTVTAEDAAEGKIQVWLVEDDITAMQRMPDGSLNANYVHQHVFRTSVNNPYGDDFSIAKGENQTLKFGCVLSPTWKRENMGIVAFIFNDKDGVVQAVRGKL
ncbi:MAG: Omp28 family outer membrane lipoprotein [Alloprevotella sp.]|nr:Omp28 family outer membrane lipoprotein [Alloprevotella sp.]